MELDEFLKDKFDAGMKKYLEKILPPYSHYTVGYIHGCKETAQLIAVAIQEYHEKYGGHK